MWNGVLPIVPWAPPPPPPPNTDTVVAVVLSRPTHQGSPNLLPFNLPLRRVEQSQLFTHSILHPNSTLSVICSSTSRGASAAGDNLPHPDPQLQDQQKKGFWIRWRENSAAMSSKLAKLGLAAVLAYGLFDGVTYTSFFVLAFLGYEKSSGSNPAANLKALLGIVLLMWTGNNVTRPFRVAGSAALAPAIDKGLRRIQKLLNFPNLISAFALVAGIVAASCLTIVSLLILSRWGK